MDGICSAYRKKWRDRLGIKGLIDHSHILEIRQALDIRTQRRLVAISLWNIGVRDGAITHTHIVRNYSLNPDLDACGFESRLVTELRALEEELECQNA